MSGRSFASSRRTQRSLVGSGSRGLQAVTYSTLPDPVASSPGAAPTCRSQSFRKSPRLWSLSSSSSRATSLDLSPYPYSPLLHEGRSVKLPATRRREPQLGACDYILTSHHGCLVTSTSLRCKPRPRGASNPLLTTPRLSYGCHLLLSQPLTSILKGGRTDSPGN